MEQGQPEIYASWISLSEEAGPEPAYLVGLSGCPRACQFCHARNDWGALPRERLTPATMATHLLAARKSAARSVQFTGGEPAVWLPSIVAALPAAPGLPLTLNTSLPVPLHLDPDRLQPFAELIVSLKFGQDRCARRLCGDGHYLGPVRERLLALADLGIALRIRHLVMPGHLDCCLVPTLAWVERCLPHVPVTLLLGYVPPAAATAPELLGTLNGREHEMVLALAALSGVCCQCLGQSVPAPSGRGNPASESFDVIIHGGGAICLPTVGHGAVDLAARLRLDQEEPT